jgi:tRNA pseudouridine55 synthase
MIKKNSNKISGWIILDKKSGITSRQAISKISKIFKFNKIGHGGTLDPLATGVLPIAVGEATKLISFIQKKKKNIHLQLDGVRQQILTIVKERS